VRVTSARATASWRREKHRVARSRRPKREEGGGGGSFSSASDDGATQMLGGGEAAAESECAPSFPLRSHAATRVRSVERLPVERDENLYRDRSAREGVKHS